MGTLGPDSHIQKITWAAVGERQRPEKSLGQDLGVGSMPDEGGVGEMEIKTQHVFGSNGDGTY